MLLPSPSFQIVNEPFSLLGVDGVGFGVGFGVGVGVTFVTVGLYFAVTGVPFLSTRLTVTSGASPTKSLSGVNVTVPSFATVYVPTLSTVFVI